MREGDPTIGQRVRQAAAFSIAGLGLGTAATLGVANHLTEHTTVGAHEGDLALTLDGHATARDMPIIGSDLRFPVDAPFHTGARFTITKTPNIESFPQVDALLASQPKGETEHIKEVGLSLARRSALGGLAIGGVGIGGIYLRRRYSGDKRGELGTIIATVSLTTTLGLLAVPGSLTNSSSSNWSPLDKQVPSLKQLHNPLVDTLEISDGTLEDTAAQLINGGVVAFKTSNAFYDPLKQKAAAIGPELHQPTADQTVAVVISDRHDNTNMDPVVRAAADAAGAEIVLDAGDDLGASQSWEMFSLNSLFTTFKDYKYKFVATGNHDWASFIPKAFEKARWNVLSGKAIPFLKGTKIIGEADPRRSSFNDLPALPGDKTVTKVGENLDAVACDNNVAVVLVHSPEAAKTVAKTGCVPLEIAGHTHILNQQNIAGTNGASFVFTNGTTGGAGGILPIALWQKLHSDATIGLATFENGMPVGIQSVVFTNSGNVEVGEYTNIPLRENTAQSIAPAGQTATAH